MVTTEGGKINGKNVRKYLVILSKANLVYTHIHIIFYIKLNLQNGINTPRVTEVVEAIFLHSKYFEM